MLCDSASQAMYWNWEVGLLYCKIIIRNYFKYKKILNKKWKLHYKLSKIYIQINYILIYCYFNKEIYMNWCFVDVMKIHPTLSRTITHYHPLSRTLTTANSKLYSCSVIFFWRVYRTGLFPTATGPARSLRTHSKCSYGTSSIAADS